MENKDIEKAVNTLIASTDRAAELRERMRIVALLRKENVSPAVILRVMADDE